MICIGLDCGAKTVKAVVLKDGNLVGKGIELARLDTNQAARKACKTALAMAQLSDEVASKAFATGVGKSEPDFVDDVLTEVTADARGVHSRDAEIKTIIDIGAEEARVIKVDANGKVVDFAVNERCAAGTGAFADAMARILEVTPEELGTLSLSSTEDIAIGAQCVVFAESEIVSLLHRQVSKPNLARAVLNAIAERVGPLGRRVGITEDVTVIGGVSRSAGFIQCLQNRLKQQIRLLPDAEYLGAVGAAVTACRKHGV